MIKFTSAICLSLLLKHLSSGLYQLEDNSTLVHVAMRWPQPIMCPVPQSMCTLHVTLCTKCEFVQFGNRIFTIKMWGEFRFKLDKRVPMTVKLSPIKGQFTFQNYQVISVSELRLSHSFQWLLLCSYKGRKIKSMQLTKRLIMYFINTFSSDHFNIRNINVAGFIDSQKG